MSTWPKVDAKKTFKQVETECGITEVARDIRSNRLGYHPSKSYYSKPEPDFDATRREYDRIIAKNRSR